MIALVTRVCIQCGCEVEAPRVKGMTDARFLCSPECAVVRKNARRREARAQKMGCYSDEQANKRRWRLKSAYGITPEQVDEMVTDQGGRCAICAVVPVPDSMGRVLLLDHDHVTGEVRGLLCSNCNIALGLMADDPDRLIAAAMYLLTQRGEQ